MNDSINKKEVLISVIVCTHNRPKLLERAINSVLNQTYDKIEVIVVDDASNSECRKIMADSSILKNDKVKIIWLPENKGVSYATNRGFEQTKGNYIALLGDDDYWVDHKKLEKQVDCFSKYGSEIGVVGTWWVNKYVNGEMKELKPEEPRNWAEKLLSGGGVICGSTPLISRKAWAAVGGLDEKLPRGTDSDFFRGVILAGFKGKIIREITTVVDVGHGNSRMTTEHGFKAAKKHFYAHTYLLYKYRNIYLRNPIAMIIRVKACIKGSLIAFLHLKSPKL